MGFRELCSSPDVLVRKVADFKIQFLELNDRNGIGLHNMFQNFV